MFTVAHFQVIQAASALTSSSVTFGWYRMPPFAGPRARLCCTRYPVRTLTEPSSISVGTDTTSWRLGGRSPSRIPSSSPIFSAAVSNCRCEISNGLRFSWAIGRPPWTPRRAVRSLLRDGSRGILGPSSKDRQIGRFWPRRGRSGAIARAAAEAGLQALGLGQLVARRLRLALAVVHVGQHVVAERRDVRDRPGAVVSPPAGP